MTIKKAYINITDVNGKLSISILKEGDIFDRAYHPKTNSAKRIFRFINKYKIGCIEYAIQPLTIKYTIHYAVRSRTVKDILSRKFDDNFVAILETFIFQEAKRHSKNISYVKNVEFKFFNPAGKLWSKTLAEKIVSEIDRLCPDGFKFLFLDTLIEQNILLSRLMIPAKEDIYKFTGTILFTIEPTGYIDESNGKLLLNPKY